MMRIELPEEAMTLLEEQLQQRQRSQRLRRAVRWAALCVAALGALSACAAAADVSAAGAGRQSVHFRDAGHDPSATDLIGWDAVSGGWCRLRSAVTSYTWCQVSGDKARCQHDAAEACAAAGDATTPSSSGSQ